MENLSRFLNAARSIKEEKLLTDLLDSLVSVLSEEFRTEKEREKLILDFIKYVEKKRPAGSMENRNELEYLKYVRNSLAHRKSVPEEVILVAIPMFWKLLKEVATEDNVQKISNLLLYSMRQKEILPYSENISLKSKIRKYETIFNKLPDQEKILVFDSMLLSFYSTEEFQEYLKKKRMSKI